MADLLTHVLAAYVLATLLALRYEWITPPLVTVAMVGAMIPDLDRLGLVVAPEWIGAALGVPFGWGAFHTLGGSLLVVLLGTLLAGPASRRRVFALLVLGAVSHHALDLLLLNPSGYSYHVLWPLTTYHPPAPDGYLSTDRWPAVVAATAAALAWAVRHRWGSTSR